MTTALALRQPDAIASACRQHSVARIHLFGSPLRDDSQPDLSDLDLLVECQALEPGDLVMADALRNPCVRADIEASERLIYGA